MPPDPILEIYCKTSPRGEMGKASQHGAFSSWAPKPVNDVLLPDRLPGGLEPLPDGVRPQVKQPDSVEFHTADGVFIKQTHIRNHSTILPQHAHTHDHTTAVAAGSVFLWKDGKLDRQYAAPSMILIRAGVWHTFMTLEDDTVLYCIHRLGNEILSANGLSKEDI